MSALASCELDYEQRTIEIVRRDGARLRVPLSTQRQMPPEIRRSRFDFSSRRLTLSVIEDKELTVDVGCLDSDDLPPSEIPVVYLDQNHWIALARQKWAPDESSSGEAAARLIAWANRGEVILPLSSAHLVELPAVDGRRRRDVVLTMLGLCRGWFLRSPVSVRKAEMFRSMTGDTRALAGVVTRDPEGLFMEGSEPYRMTAPGPPELKRTFERIVSISAVYAGAIEGDVDKAPGREAGQRWAEAFHEEAQRLAEQGASQQRTRAVAGLRLLADLGAEPDEMARAAGLDQAAYQGWLARFSEAVDPLPFLGRYGELIYLRLRNPGDVWQGNDLNDLTYLGCATGYADVVVGENQTVDYLRRAERRLGRKARLCSGLTEAVDYLRPLIDTPAGSG